MFRFREAREAAHISQKSAAITLNVSAPSMSAWENGKNGPSLENLVAMAKLYNVTTDYLLGLDENTKAVPAIGVSTYDEAILVQVFRQLTDIGQTAVMTTAKALLEQPGMRKDAAIPSAM